MTVTWESRFPGINDTLRYRTVGSPDWQIGVNPELENTSQTLIDDALFLLAVQMPSTLMPLFLLPDICFTQIPFGLTLEGQ